MTQSTQPATPTRNPDPAASTHQHVRGAEKRAPRNASTTPAPGPRSQGKDAIASAPPHINVYPTEPLDRPSMLKAAALGALVPLGVGILGGASLIGIVGCGAVGLAQLEADVARDAAHLALSGDIQGATRYAVVESVKLGSCGVMIASVCGCGALLNGALLFTSPVLAVPCGLWAAVAAHSA